MRAHYNYVVLLLLGISVAAYPSSIGQSDTPPYRNSSLPPDKRADDLLARMTLDEKIGQMTQGDSDALRSSTSDVASLGLGSVLSGGSSEAPDISASGWRQFVDAFQVQALSTRLGIPILYGIDAVHGHNNVRGAVIFPHNIGLGATRNPRLVEQVARITALEVAATGMHWVFAPCIAVARDERWGRTYESFGETPELATLLGEAAIRGLQRARTAGPGQILATAKHFAGDGGTGGGVDRGNTVGDEATLRELHVSGYRSAIAAGVGSLMVSYSSWNGVRMHGNKQMLTDLLRGELGFEGVLVSDWNGIDDLSGDRDSDVEQAINAGIDMVMVPTAYREFIQSLKRNVEIGRVAVARIDQAVRRILIAKFRIGLFEHPFGDKPLLEKVGSSEHRAVARQAVRESQVLLINRNDILPLRRNLQRIAVAGKVADDLGLQSGGWTISWQGAPGPVTEGTTVLAAIRKTAPKASVSFTREGNVDRNAQVAVIVIGEQPYAEMKGDRTDLSLDPADVEVVRNAKKAGVPVVVVLLSVR